MPNLAFHDSSSSLINEESKIQSSTGQTITQLTKVVVKRTARKSMEFPSRSIGSLLSKKKIDTNLKNMSIEYEKQNIRVRSWAGKVITVREHSFIAELTDTMDLSKKTKVEINSSFPNIDITAFSIHSRFILKQVVDGNGGVKTSIEISKDAISRVSSKKIVDAQMRKFSYLFGEEENV